MRDRVEAAGVHDPRAGRDGTVVVLEVHPVDELRLAGEVDVVGARGRAGGDERLAVLQVGTDRGDHDPGGLGHRPQRVVVGAVRLRAGAARRAPGRSSPAVHAPTRACPGCARPGPSAGLTGRARPGRRRSSSPVKPVAPKMTMSCSGGSRRGGEDRSGVSAGSGFSSSRRIIHLAHPGREPTGPRCVTGDMEAPAKSALGGGLVTVSVLGGLVAQPCSRPRAPARPRLRRRDPVRRLRRTAGLVRRPRPRRRSAPGAGGRPLDHARLRRREDGSAGECRGTLCSRESGKAVANGSTGTNIQEAGRRRARRGQDQRADRRTAGGGQAWSSPTSPGSRARAGRPGHCRRTRTPTGCCSWATTCSSPGTAAHRRWWSRNAATEIAPTLQPHRAVRLDLSDPPTPAWSDAPASGRHSSLRQYADTVRLVTATGLPRCPSCSPGGLERGTRPQQRNREIVRRVDAYRGLGSRPRLQRRLPPADLVRLGDRVRRHVPSRRRCDAATQVAVTGAGSEVYSSADRLYVTATDWGDQVVHRPADDQPETSPRSASSGRCRPRAPTSTPSPSRGLDPLRRLGRRPRHGPGPLVPRREDGHLRVAVAWPDRGGQPRENGSSCWPSGATGSRRSARCAGSASTRRSSLCAGSTTWPSS